MKKVISQNRLVLFCLSLLLACSVSACTGTVTDPLLMVATAPDEAAKMVVVRGDVYCTLPKPIRDDFRARVMAAGKASPSGLFEAEVITCKGDVPAKE